MTPRAKSIFGWKPYWNVETAIEKIVEWVSVYLTGDDVSACMDRQIEEFYAGMIDKMGK